MKKTPLPLAVDEAGETRLTFVSNGLRLQGTLHYPRRRRPNLIVGSHGLYSSGDSPKQIALAEHCCRMGLAYFRFDHRGCGRSQGRFDAVTTLPGRRNDLVDAVAHLQGRFALGDALGLFGSSFGGAVCLSAAVALRPRRLATLAAPVDSRSILTALRDQPNGLDPIFFQDSFQFDLQGDLGALQGVLVIHGGSDDVIPSRHADTIYEGVKEPKARLVLPGGDHRLSREDHQAVFLEACLDWFKPLTR